MLVTDSGRILRLADAEARKSQPRRISVICIDAAPNSFLVNELAERGGGSAMFLTSDPDQQDIATALDGVLESFAQPILVDVRLEVDRLDAQTAGHLVTAGRRPETTAIDLGDLPRGRALWAVGRAPRNGRDDLSLTVTVGGRDVATHRATLNPAGTRRPALKALFGARRVLILEMLLTAYYEPNEASDILKHLGYSATTQHGKDRPSAVYAENETEILQEAIRKLLCREALEYGLASSATAFVARRTEAGQVVEASVAVPNALPAGWSNLFAAGGPAAPQSSWRFRSRGPQRSYSAPASVMRRLSGISSCANMPAAAFMAADAMIQESALTVESPASDFLEETTASLANSTPQFSGVPAFVGQEAVLFDTARSEDAGRLPVNSVLTSLTVRFPAGAPDPTILTADMALLLYIDDMAAPRARVTLADLLRQGGSRPLNLRRSNRQTVRLVLKDPSGVLATNRVALEVILA